MSEKIATIIIWSALAAISIGVIVAISIAVSNIVMWLLTIY